MFSRILTKKSTQSFSEQIERLETALQECDAVVIGAGAGLSAAAGLTYDGERFEKYFSDFEKKYGFHDMYSGGFYPFPTEEERWAYWSRNIWINRYMDAPRPVYQNLLRLVQDKDYFVITTNVDHQFQKAGFDKKRLFYGKRPLVSLPVTFFIGKSIFSARGVHFPKSLHPLCAENAPPLEILLKLGLFAKSRRILYGGFSYIYHDILISKQTWGPPEQSRRAPCLLFYGIFLTAVYRRKQVSPGIQKGFLNIILYCNKVLRPCRPCAFWSPEAR